MTNPPAEMGRYAVYHRGRIFGDAFYVAEAFSSWTAGWHQLPHFGATHWLNSSYTVEEGKNRFWPTPTMKYAPKTMGPIRKMLNILLSIK